MEDEITPVSSDNAESSDLTDAGVIEQAATEPPFWSWLRGLFFRPPDVERRLADLDKAIHDRPQVAGNYVLRGEVWMQAGEYQQAADDFSTALILASEQFEEEDWGLLAQALRDQAEHGLEVARRKMSGQRGE